MSETISSVPKVYKAIADVMAGLAKAGISKGRKNEQQGYMFRGIDEVYNALAGFLVEAKLVILPHFRDRLVVERTSASNKALFYVTVVGEFELVSTDDGSRHSVGPFYGEAMDSGDKATNKAMSAAYKYMAMEVFCIPTAGNGKDNEEDTFEILAKRERLVADCKATLDEANATTLREATAKALAIALQGDDMAAYQEIRKYSAKRASALGMHLKESA